MVDFLSICKFPYFFYAVVLSSNAGNEGAVPGQGGGLAPVTELLKTHLIHLQMYTTQFKLIYLSYTALKKLNILYTILLFQPGPFLFLSDLCTIEFGSSSNNSPSDKSR